MNPLEWGARRRQNELERRAQDAFLAEIAVHWTPAEPWQRRLRWRSSLTHLGERLLGGGPTMAAVGVAAVPTAIGAALVTVAPTPHLHTYGAGEPAWSSALLTLGLFGLMFELFRSPRTVHVRRLTVLAALPLAVGSYDGAATVGWHFGPDKVLVGAFLLVGTGMSVIVLANAFVSTRLGQRSVQLALKLSALGCLLVVAADYPWTVMYWRDHDREMSLGCCCAATGALLIAIGVLRSTPDVAG
ncbi:hypothetical protein acdb102_30080 [Acidothermaceae bacterium B102]|nr:hypothetical protein acdb102_30080 [Acidothermaceae bacterium B102]